MIQTLKYIIDVYGLDILKDGSKLLAYYADLSPKQQRERQMLEYLVKCNGHIILLNALHDTNDEQIRKMKLLVERMVAQLLVSDDIAEITCQNFWEAIGGTPIVLKRPKSVPTSYNSKNLQGDERENATPLRKRVLQAIDEGPTIESIVDRGFMSLEDGAYDEAKRHFDRVLNVHPQCADAYLGLFMAEIKARNKSQAGKIFADGDLTGNRFYQRAKQFADTSLKVELESWEKQRNNRLFREVEAREEARKAKEAAEEARQTRILELRTIRSKYDQCRFVISAGDWHTIGLKADGTVVATVITLRDNDIIKPDFGQCEVSGWTDIIAVGAGSAYTVGLKADGTVVAVGSKAFGVCDISSWKNIVAVSSGEYHAVGLKADGTVVATGLNDDGQCDVSNWRDIVSVSAGSCHTIGLKADGTVVAVGKNNVGQCNVSSWADIVAVGAGGLHTVGLKADGTVVAAGYNNDGQCDVNGWKLCKNPLNFMEESKQKRAQKKEERYQKQRQEQMLMYQRKKLTAAKNELAELHGLFAGKRRKELRQEIAELEINIQITKNKIEEITKRLDG